MPRVLVFGNCGNGVLGTDKEFYFHNGKLIKYEDRSGREALNIEQEKKMYESRLPYEVADLLEILKKH
jgi:hypothetical protein